MRINIFAFVSIAIFVILLLGVSLTGILGYYKYKGFYIDLISDHQALVLSDIRHTIETSLSLGLPVEKLPGVTRAMRERVDQDPRIFSIEFYDKNGAILYSVDESLRGDLVAEEWISLANQEEEINWIRLESDALVIGVNIYDSLGNLVGAIALRYTRLEFDEETRSIAWQIFALCQIIIMIFVVIGAGMAYFLIRKPRQQLHEMRQSIEPDGVAMADKKKTTAGSFAQKLCEAEAMIAEAEESLHEIEEQDTPRTALRAGP